MKSVHVIQRQEPTFPGLGKRELRCDQENDTQESFGIVHGRRGYQNRFGDATGLWMK
jgi:hypothetical protein